jgi:hypothetical protein
MTQPRNPYGSDMAITVGSNGALDLEPTMRDVTGLHVYIQSLVMRQTTATGSVLAVPDDCFDVRGWISKEMAQSQVATIASQVQSQLLKDERTLTAVVVASFNPATAQLVLVESILSSLGPFKLTLALTQSAVSFIVDTQGLQ